MRIMMFSQSNTLDRLLSEAGHNIIAKQYVTKDDLVLIEIFQPHLIVALADELLPPEFVRYISGIEMCRQLRTQYSANQLPIVLTPESQDNREVWEEAWRAGANLVFWARDYEGLFQALQPFLRPEKSLSRF